MDDLPVDVEPREEDEDHREGSLLGSMLLI